jgi:dTDP-4-amino-4,6-dideoxygalactose transaminase
MHLQPLYKNKQFFGGKIAEELFQKGLCLPSGSNLTLQEKDRIQNTILSFLDQ